LEEGVLENAGQLFDVNVGAKATDRKVTQNAVRQIGQLNRN